MIEYRDAKEEAQKKILHAQEWAAALREGELARLDGKPKGSCPYPEGELKQAWLRGWWKEF